jgi:hypothetical protein
MPLRRACATRRLVTTIPSGRTSTGSPGRRPVRALPPAGPGPPELPMARHGVRTVGPPPGDAAPAGLRVGRPGCCGGPCRTSSRGSRVRRGCHPCWPRTDCGRTAAGLCRGDGADWRAGLDHDRTMGDFIVNTSVAGGRLQPRPARPRPPPRATRRLTLHRRSPHRSHCAPDGSGSRAATGGAATRPLPGPPRRRRRTRLTGYELCAAAGADRRNGFARLACAVRRPHRQATGLDRGASRS